MENYLHFKLEKNNENFKNIIRNSNVPTLSFSQTYNIKAYDKNGNPENYYLMMPTQDQFSKYVHHPFFKHLGVRVFTFLLLITNIIILIVIPFVYIRSNNGNVNYIFDNYDKYNAILKSNDDMEYKNNEEMMRNMKYNISLGVLYVGNIFCLFITMILVMMFMFELMTESVNAHRNYAIGKY